MASQTTSSASPPAVQTAASGCKDSVTFYNQTGLVVPFRNLCGKDISAPVDFDESYLEATFADCLAHCVEKQPLCYGFDFRPVGAGATNCWLKKAEFDDRTAVSRDFAVDAAMLGPELLTTLSNDCRELGLLGCFNKNGRLRRDPTETMSSSVSVASSLTSTAAASTSTAPVSSSNGLSTGASIGIGVGVGVAVLGAVVVGLLFLLRRRKRRAQNTNTDGTVSVGHVHAPEKSAAPTEMYAQHSYHHTAELESPGFHAQPVQGGVTK